MLRRKIQRKFIIIIFKRCHLKWVEHFCIQMYAWDLGDLRVRREGEEKKVQDIAFNFFKHKLELSSNRFSNRIFVAFDERKVKTLETHFHLPSEIFAVLLIRFWLNCLYLENALDFLRSSRTQCIHWNFSICFSSSKEKFFFFFIIFKRDFEFIKQHIRRLHACLSQLQSWKTQHNASSCKHESHQKEEVQATYIKLWVINTNWGSSKSLLCLYGVLSFVLSSRLPRSIFEFWFRVSK